MPYNIHNPFFGVIISKKEINENTKRYIRTFKE